MSTMRGQGEAGGDDVSVNRKTIFGRNGLVLLASIFVVGAMTMMPVGADPSGSVSGTVSYNGTGIGGVCVDAMLTSGGTVFSATSASDGAYTISGLGTAN